MNIILVNAGMKMHSTDLLMKSTLLLHMIGGKGQFTAYFQCLLILVLGHGNSGVEERKFTGFKTMSSLNMIIPVSALVGRVPYTRG